MNIKLKINWEGPGYYAVCHPSRDGDMGAIPMGTLVMTLGDLGAAIEKAINGMSQDDIDEMKGWLVERFRAPYA